MSRTALYSKHFFKEVNNATIEDEISLYRDSVIYNVTAARRACLDGDSAKARKHRDEAGRDGSIYLALLSIASEP